MKQPTQLKELGNNAFSKGEYKEAVDYYMEAASMFEHTSANVGCLSLENDNDIELLGIIWSNTSECYLQLQDFDSAESAASKAIEISSNTKAFHRRASARFQNGDYFGAAQDAIHVQSSKGKELARIARERFHCQRLIVDSYRLRVEDEYATAGTVDSGCLYDLRSKGLKRSPRSHFFKYVKEAWKKGVLPSWFTIDEDFDKLYSLATTHSIYNINFAVEIDDITEHYGKLQMPAEEENLRELALAIKGPIQSKSDQFIRDNSSHCEEIFRGDCNEKQIFISPSWLKQGDKSKFWWQREPYAPESYIYNEGDDVAMDQVLEFREIFGFMPPLGTFPRLNLDIILHGRHGEMNYDYFVFILIEGRFGSQHNKLSPEEFVNVLDLFQINQRCLLEKEFGSDTMKEVGSSIHPGQWHFDHYGLICSLAIAAYKSLSKKLKESAEIQKRLTEVLLCGNEFTLTELVSSDTPQQKDIWIESTSVDGISMPCGWKEDGGKELMMKAWEIWFSVFRARQLINTMEKNDFAGEEIITTSKDGKFILNFPCFCDTALEELFFPTRWNRTPWDAGLQVINLYVRAVKCVMQSEFECGNLQDALNLGLKTLEKLNFATKTKDNLHEKQVIHLRLYIAHSFVKLQNFEEAENQVKQVQSLIKIQQKCGKEIMLEDELDESHSLLNDIMINKSKKTQEEGKTGMTLLATSFNIDEQN